MSYVLCQTRVQNAVNNSEEKWKKLIQETAEKERENVRNEMLVEQEEKMSQLQAQWVEALSEKGKRTNYADLRQHIHRRP